MTNYFENNNGLIDIEKVFVNVFVNLMKERNI